MPNLNNDYHRHQFRLSQVLKKNCTNCTAPAKSLAPGSGDVAAPHHPQVYPSLLEAPVLSAEPTWIMTRFILRALRAPCADNRTVYINLSSLAPLLCYRLD